MSEICATCALPKPLCVCETIAKESQRIKVYSEKKKFGKISTIIEGLNEREIDLKEVAKKLKSSLACGGTAKQGKIELQGEHKQKVKKYLVQMGFGEDSIEVR
jgi:translation initiation factor 1